MRRRDFLNVLFGTAAALALAAGIALNAAHAGTKDESAAEWLAPKWFNEWHDALAASGLAAMAIAGGLLYRKRTVLALVRRSMEQPS